jgi:choline dehydrogenase
MSKVKKGISMGSGIANSGQFYDYIVVGAGSAGCVVARRLAEAGCSVLLLEAGSEAKNLMLHIPLGFAFLLKPHKNNWAYKTIPEKSLNNRRADLPRGKVLGGCSAINGMVYVRGQKEDYDRWNELLDSKDDQSCWSYNDVLPYFKRSEDFQNSANHYHGSGGALFVGDLKSGKIPAEFPICEAFINAAQQAGYPRNDDINGATQEGAGYFPHNIKHGKRWSAATAFLKEKHRNLAVITEAGVNRVLVRVTGNRKQATGVECVVQGKTMQFSAQREVILCGGAINSPKILELSGIGQKERLQKLGINVVHDLPGVGENLHDHWNGYIKANVKNCTTYFTEAKPLRMIKNLLRYILKKESFLANPAALVAVFYKSHPGAGRADAQIHFAPAASDVDIKGNMVPIDGVTIAACGLRPTSRGSTHIVSTELSVHPAIEVNYLKSEHDKQIAVESFRRAREILAQPAMQQYGAIELEPGAKVQSDADLLTYIARTGDPVHHLAGSCKMGSDAMAVVDDQLRVRGIMGLRVADASIMPEIVSGNTHAACVMIGEKVAGMIIRGT